MERNKQTIFTDSPYRDAISHEILKLTEDEVIDERYQHWWKKMDGGGQCKEEKVEQTSDLKFENVAGVFVVLALGSALALLFACCEFLWMAKKNAKEDRVRNLQIIVNPV